MELWISVRVFTDLLVEECESNLKGLMLWVFTDLLLLWRFDVVGLMLWVESGLKGCHGGLSNRLAAEGYRGGFACCRGFSLWVRFMVAMYFDWLLWLWLWSFVGFFCVCVFCLVV